MFVGDAAQDAIIFDLKAIFGARRQNENPIHVSMEAVALEPLYLEQSRGLAAGPYDHRCRRICDAKRCTGNCEAGGQIYDDALA